ncbi:hypothetical protein [Pseudomonas sp. L1(2025)]|uniref:hypothetical protein n=1 Tax=Pseudomonas sp. L1(2025) TaxID=3449429 RepID=UPI003F68E2BD
MDDENSNVDRPALKEQIDTGLDKMMSSAWEEVKSDFSYGSFLDKAASSAKLLGKGSLYAGVKMIQNLPAAVEKMKENQSKKG